MSQRNFSFYKQKWPKRRPHCNSEKVFTPASFWSSSACPLVNGIWMKTLHAFNPNWNFAKIQTKKMSQRNFSSYKQKWPKRRPLCNSVKVFTPASFWSSSACLLVNEIWMKTLHAFNPNWNFAKIQTRKKCPKEIFPFISKSDQKDALIVTV